MSLPPIFVVPKKKNFEFILPFFTYLSLRAPTVRKSHHIISAAGIKQYASSCYSLFFKSHDHSSFLLAVSEPVIQPPALHVCWHSCVGQLPCVITRTTNGLPASLLTPHRTVKIPTSQHISLCSSSDQILQRLSVEQWKLNDTLLLLASWTEEGNGNWILRVMLGLLYFCELIFSILSLTFSTLSTTMVFLP